MRGLLRSCRFDLVALWTAAVLLLGVLGCQSPEVRREIVYVPIPVGAGAADVTHLVGPPVSTSLEGEWEIWSYTGGSRVVFKQGRVVEPSAIGVPLTAENGSTYGETSPATGRPKTVYVHGYFRKDGTYVRSHYRSKHK